LVAQLQIHERLVVTPVLQLVLALLQLELVQLELVQLELVQLVLVQLVVQLLVQRVQQLFVAPLELAEPPCLQKKLMLQKKLQEFLAY
jgi:hypothetical protein